MKIVLVSDDFPPIRESSVASVAFNLARGLLDRGHEVSAITRVEEESQAGEMVYEGIKIFKIHLPDYHVRWQAWRSLSNPKAVKEIKSILESIKPDVTHFHNIHKYISYRSFKIAKQHSRSVFLTTHDVMLFHYSKFKEFINEKNPAVQKDFNYKVNPWMLIKRFKRRYNPFRNMIIRHYVKYLDKIFAVSQELKKALAQNNIKNVEVVNNGLDAGDWIVSDSKIGEFKDKLCLQGKKIVLFGGRLSALKGGELIVKSMAIVSQRIPESVLLVLGDENDYARYLAKLAKSLGIRLVFTGWINGNDLKAAYHPSDLAVTPS
ncbi:MAG: glycosyltransferase family 4 protein, partial [Patescibacteria group bacterium]